MQEPVQLLALVSRINPCTFCFYISKLAHNLHPHTFWKALRNTRHSRLLWGLAETLIIPSRYRGIRSLTHIKKHEYSFRLVHSVPKCTFYLESFIYFWNWQKIAWIWPAREKYWWASLVLPCGRSVGFGIFVGLFLKIEMQVVSPMGLANKIVKCWHQVGQKELCCYERKILSALVNIMFSTFTTDQYF